MLKLFTRNKTTATVLLIVILFVVLLYVTGPIPKTKLTVKDVADVNALKFSNTADWDPQFLPFINKEPHFLPKDWESKVTLLPPPTNDSLQTKSELASMVAQKSERSTTTMQAIINEELPSTLNFGGYTFNNYMDAKLFPKTSALLTPVFARDINVVIFIEKAKYDRVRPAILNPSLDPAIEVPGHPAYPSGHSSQAHLLALIFSELAPQRADEFKARAWEIAVHREIAGLHYRSDSEAGKLLAPQMMVLLKQNPDFNKLILDAKSEWTEKGLDTKR